VCDILCRDAINSYFDSGSFFEPSSLPLIDGGGAAEDSPGEDEEEDAENMCQGIGDGTLSPYEHRTYLVGVGVCTARAIHTGELGGLACAVELAAILHGFCQS